MIAILRVLAEQGSVSVLRRNRDLRRYELGDGLSLIGVWMQRLALGWLVWELTGSAPWLAVVSFAEVAPILLLTPFTGTVADRFSPLRIMHATQAILLAQAFVLWVLATTGTLSIWMILLNAGLTGIVTSFNMPARLTYTPTLVPVEDLPSAVATHAIFFNGSRFVAPLIGGALIASVGAHVVFLVNSITFIVYLRLLFLLPMNPQHRSTAVGSSFLSDLASGLTYVRLHPGVGPLLVVLFALGVGMRPVDDLLPGLAASVFQSDARGLSLLAAAIAAGAIGGNLWLAGRARSAGLVGVVILGAGLGGAGAFLTAAAPGLYFAVPALALFGFGTATAVTALQTVVFLTTAPDMRGRVMGLYALIYRGAPACGALATYLISLVFSLRWPLALGAALFLFAGVWLHRRRHPVLASIPAPGTKALSAR